MKNLSDPLKYITVHPDACRIVHCSSGWHGNTVSSINKFFYVLEGSFVLNIEDKSYFVHKNQIAFLPANRHHSFWLLPDVNLTIIDFQFHSEVNGEDLFVHYGCTEDNHVITLPEQPMLDIHNSMTAPSGDSFDLIPTSLRWCSELTKLSSMYIQARIARENAKEEFAEVISYMHSHITEDISLEELAALNHLEPTYFSAKFKKETGVSPLKYFAQIRAKKAAHLLRTSDMSMADIAAEIGFSNVYYFKRYFEKHMGIRPERYKEIFIMPSHVHPTYI